MGVETFNYFGKRKDFSAYDWDVLINGVKITESIPDFFKNDFTFEDNAPESASSLKKRLAVTPVETLKRRSINRAKQAYRSEVEAYLESNRDMLHEYTLEWDNLPSFAKKEENNKAPMYDFNKIEADSKRIINKKYSMED